MEQRSLVGYCPQGCKELDSTKATQHKHAYISFYLKSFSLFSFFFLKKCLDSSSLLNFSEDVSNNCLLFSCEVVSNYFVTPWTVAHQAPLSMGFPRQEYQNGFPFPSPGDLLNPEIEPASPALAGGFLTTESPRKPLLITVSAFKDIYSGIELNL